jgi:hypothetical protein
MSAADTSHTAVTCLLETANKARMQLHAGGGGINTERRFDKLM